MILEENQVWALQLADEKRKCIEKILYELYIINVFINTNIYILLSYLDPKENIAKVNQNMMMID